MRTARLADLDDGELRELLAGNATRIANGEPPRVPTKPKGLETFQQPIAMAWDARGRLWIAECYTLAENPQRWDTNLRDRIVTLRIAPGEPANLTLVDLEREWVVGDGGYESRSANCCFDGQTLRGKVLLTVAAGAIAFRARQLEVVR